MLGFPQDLKSIIQAIGTAPESQGYNGSGHWNTCPNGHVPPFSDCLESNADTNDAQVTRTSLETVVVPWSNPPAPSAEKESAGSSTGCDLTTGGSRPSTNLRGQRDSGPEQIQIEGVVICSESVS